jgi:hypothetical protein
MLSIRGIEKLTATMDSSFMYLSHQAHAPILSFARRFRFLIAP